MRPDIVGFGALNLDKLYRVSRIAEAGDETFVKGLTISPGGSAANTVVGLSRLGVRTGYIGKLARDIEGDYLLKDLQREKVEISGIKHSKHGRTGVCIGFIDDLGERVLYIDPGVNDSLKFDEIRLEYADSSKFLHLTSFVGGVPFNAQKRLVRNLRRAEICLDPGELYSKKGISVLSPLLKRTLAILPNEKEIRALTKRGYKEGSRTLLSLGVELVAVKLGKRGCYVTDAKESHLIPASKIAPKDTTGAGDAFCAGFIYGLLHGKDLYACGKLGNLVASRCIEEYGARTGLPLLADLPRI